MYKKLGLILLMIIITAGSSLGMDCGDGIPPIPMTIQGQAIVNGEPIDNISIDIYLGGEYFKTTTSFYSDTLDMHGLIADFVDGCDSNNGEELLFKYEHDYGTFVADETGVFETSGFFPSPTEWQQLHFTVVETHTITGELLPVSGNEYTYHVSVHLTEPMDTDFSDGFAQARQLYVGMTDADLEATELINVDMVDSLELDMPITFTDKGEHVVFYSVQQIDSSLVNGVQADSDQYEIKHESLTVDVQTPPYERPSFQTFASIWSSLWSWIMNIFG